MQRNKDDIEKIKNLLSFYKNPSSFSEKDRAKLLFLPTGLAVSSRKRQAIGSVEDMLNADGKDEYFKFYNFPNYNASYNVVDTDYLKQAFLNNKAYNPKLKSEVGLNPSQASDVLREINKCLFNLGMPPVGSRFLREFVQCLLSKDFWQLQVLFILEGIISRGYGKIDAFTQDSLYVNDFLTQNPIFQGLLISVDINNTTAQEFSKTSSGDLIINMYSILPVNVSKKLGISRVSTLKGDQFAVADFEKQVKKSSKNKTSQYIVTLPMWGYSNKKAIKISENMQVIASFMLLNHVNGCDSDYNKDLLMKWGNKYGIDNNTITENNNFKLVSNRDMNNTVTIYRQGNDLYSVYRHNDNYSFDTNRILKRLGVKILSTYAYNICP